jgi:hypothetical protein
MAGLKDLQPISSMPATRIGVIRRARSNRALHVEILRTKAGEMLPANGFIDYPVGVKVPAGSVTEGHRHDLHREVDRLYRLLKGAAFEFHAPFK